MSFSAVNVEPHHWEGHLQRKQRSLGLSYLVVGLLCPLLGFGQSKPYDPGVIDTEIKIGQTMPYSGPASAYATVGRAHAAFFEMINAQGGINGRKIKLISLDDAMTPPRAVEQVRKLVEDEQVFITFGILGISNFAVQKYLNTKKVPHLFPSAASVRFHDPKNYPWTMGWVPSFDFEARLYARYILANRPNAKIAILYLNDDLGKEYVRGFKEGLGDKAVSPPPSPNSAAKRSARSTTWAGGRST